MRKVVQSAVIKVVRPQVVEYYCDRCGKQCGTKGNQKETWYGTGEKPGRTFHYCKRTCSPANHPTVHHGRDVFIAHIAECEMCLNEAMASQDQRVQQVLAGAVLDALKGQVSSS